MTTPLITCKDVYKYYQMGGTQLVALRDINLTVNAGEHIAILGPSGSGKSTLMNILGCLDSPSKGQYSLSGEDVSDLTRNELAYVRNYKIGFIFQSFNLLSHATSLENVMLPLVYRGVKLKQRKVMAQEMLKRVNLENRMHHLPSELSGGQCQRVAIARALVTNPDLILADEPTGNLDSKTGNTVMDFFDELTQEGKTVMIVTHDLELAKRSQRVIHIHDGAIDRLG